MIVLVDDVDEGHEIAGDMRRHGQRVNVRQLANDGAIRTCEPVGS